MTKTNTKSTKVIEHIDRLGNKLTVGAYVAYPDGNHLHVGVVKKLNPKMISIESIDTIWKSKCKKYPYDCLVLEGPRLTMYLIKNSR